MFCPETWFSMTTSHFKLYNHILKQQGEELFDSTSMEIVVYAKSIMIQDAKDNPNGAKYGQLLNGLDQVLYDPDLFTGAYDQIDDPNRQPILDEGNTQFSFLLNELIKETPRFKHNLLRRNTSLWVDLLKQNIVNSSFYPSYDPPKTLVEAFDNDLNKFAL